MIYRRKERIVTYAIEQEQTFGFLILTGHRSLDENDNILIIDDKR
jgi:hypothetical protein